MPQVRRLGDLTSPEVAALDPRPVVLFPVGIVEEHGPHLPLDTDSIQAVATCEAVSERTGALVAPLLAYGQCSSTRFFPGSVSVSFDTLRALVKDLLHEFARQGFLKLAFVSGHAGGAHMRALKLAVEESLERHPGLKVLVLADWELLHGLDPKEAAGVDVPRWDGHAGALETSRMLALRPDLVKGTAHAHRVEFPEFLVELDPSRHFPTGVMGDPTLASAKLGHAANAHIVQRLSRLVDDLARA